MARNKARPQPSRDVLIARIKTEQLVTRVQKHALNQLEEGDEMTDSQLRAAFGLLARTLPEIRQAQVDNTHTFDGDPATIANAAIISELLDRSTEKDAGRAVRQSH